MADLIGAVPVVVLGVFLLWFFTLKHTNRLIDSPSDEYELREIYHWGKD